MQKFDDKIVDSNIIHNSFLAKSCRYLQILLLISQQKSLTTVSAKKEQEGKGFVVHGSPHKLIIILTAVRKLKAINFWSFF